MSRTDPIAARYTHAVTRLKSGDAAGAFDELRAIIGATEPVSERETEAEIIRPYQAEPSEFAAAAAESARGKPVRLVLDYFTAALYHAGCALVAMGEHAEARLYLEEVYGLWPKNVTAKLQFAFVLAELEEGASAVAVVQEAAELAPDDPRVARQLVWTYNELEQFAEARAEGERWVARHPSYRPLLEELHAAYTALGETARAAAIAARLAELPGQA